MDEGEFINGIGGESRGLLSYAMPVGDGTTFDPEAFRRYMNQMVVEQQKPKKTPAQRIGATEEEVQERRSKFYLIEGGGEW